MAIDPKSRGVEGEKAASPPKSDKAPTKIVKVISYGNGWLAVEMDDGMQYKRDGGTIAWRNNNPGNIKHGPFAIEHGSVGKGGEGMAVFPTLGHGKRAQKNLLFTPVRGYDEKSLLAAMKLYAPDSDGNDPVAYAHYVAKYAKVSYLKVLKTFTEEEKDRMLDAMGKMEGFRPGVIGRIKQ